MSKQSITKHSMSETQVPATCDRSLGPNYRSHAGTCSRQQQKKQQLVQPRRELNAKCVLCVPSIKTTSKSIDSQSSISEASFKNTNKKVFIPSSFEAVCDRSFITAHLLLTSLFGTHVFFLCLRYSEILLGFCCAHIGTDSKNTFLPNRRDGDLCVCVCFGGGSLRL